MRFYLPFVTLLALLTIILAGCDGSNGAPAPGEPDDWAYLHQQAPGDAPTIRLELEQPSVPLPEQIYAWLFFRGEQQYFSLTADRLVDVSFESRLPGGVWDDSPVGHGFIERRRDFTWISGQGEESGSIEVEYNHPALQPGVRYYHRVQRVVEPLERPGSPITAAVGTAQVAMIEVDPWNALSQGSLPTRGVTYIVPAVLQTPAAGSVNQPTSAITFVWNTTPGADEYVLQVFQSDDPGGQRNPRYQVTLRQDFSGTMNHTFTDNFTPGARFYWRVGARRSGEAQPVNQALLQRGWLFSEMRSFYTAQAPPPPPGN